MKTLRILITALVLSGATLGFAADPLAESLQKGLFEEEANHNLDAAIQAYRSVVALGNDQRKLMATAVFRLGECYRKQGKKPEAAAQFELVLRDFSDQPELVQYSRQILASLGATGSAATNTLQNASITSAEADEIKSIQGLIRNSPDLINAPGLGNLTPLQNAALNGQLLVARFLLDNQASIDKGDETKRTALHYAATRGHKAMVELLLAHHANVEARDRSGSTPLALAAGNGFKAVVQVLLDNHADVNAKSEYDLTPLHQAAAHGHLETMELLLSSGADVNATNKTGATPLYQTVAGQQVAAARLLVAKKADVHAGPDGRPLLSYAVANEQADIVQLLLAQGADPNAEGSFHIHNYDFTSSVLTFAVEKGNQAIVEALLKCKADVNHRDARGAQPLLCAVARNQLTIAELLLAHGAEVDARGSWQGKFWESGQIEGYANLTPLLLAVQQSHREMAALLLRHQADANKPYENEWGGAPIHVAVGAVDLELVKILLANHAEANVREKHGRTPLQVALEVAGNRNAQEIDRAKAREIAQLLRDHGASEDILRRPYITLSRKSRDFRNPLVRVDADQFNRFTLFEIIAKTFTREGGQFSGQSTTSDLAFPDFRHLTMDRLTAREGEHQTITVNLEQLLAADEPKDLDLEWGDIIEIPELDHPINQTWPGLSSEQFQILKKSLKRQVRLVVKGQTNGVDLVYTGIHRPGIPLAPGFPVGNTRVLPSRRLPAGQPVKKAAKDNPIPPPTELADATKPAVPEGTAPPTNPADAAPAVEFAAEPAATVDSFWLSDVVRGTGLLRASSDTSRITVTRAPLGAGQPKNMVYNLESTGALNDLWLRDGDLITVPEKE